MSQCPVCGVEFTGRSKHCSPRCKQQQKRNTTSAELLAHIRYSPLVETIIRHALREGVHTMAVVAGVDIAELNRHVITIRKCRWQTGCQLHLSHFTSAQDRGQFSPDNLGFWPSCLNQKLGKQSLNIGQRVPDRHWNNANLQCYTPDEAYKILDKMHGKAIRKLALDGSLNRPYRLDPYLSLKRRGCKLSFSHVHRMTQQDFESLLRKFDIQVPEQTETVTDVVALRQLMHRELIRQARLYPSVRENVRPFLHDLTNHPDEIAIDVLALATIHNFTEARALMNSYDPEKDNHQQRDANTEQPYTVDLIRWQDNEHRWNTTEVPHADFYQHHNMPF